MNLGKKIRKQRKRNNITINDLAKTCSLSPSYISQVERNIANPSVGALKKIANALNVPIVTFFSDQEEEKLEKDEVATVIRKNKRKTLYYPKTEIKYQLLSPNLQGDIEFLYIVGPPGSDSGEKCFQHESEECGVVIEGTMEVHVNGHKYILEEGDSICFNSSYPHRWINPGQERFVAIWTVTPPSF